MRVKIFSAPGDHRDDFHHVEDQMNEWMAESKPQILDMQTVVSTLPVKRDVGYFVLTVIVRYE